MVVAFRTAETNVLGLAHRHETRSFKTRACIQEGERYARNNHHGRKSGTSNPSGSHTRNPRALVSRK